MQNLKLDEFVKINENACEFYHNNLLDKNNSFGLNYLLQRKISLDLIKDYKIGFAPYSQDCFLKMNIDKLDYSIVNLLLNNLVFLNEKLEYKDYFRNRIIIPIKDNNNNLVGFSGRSLSTKSDCKYLNSKTHPFFNKSEIMFNFSNFDKSKYNEIYIVEGFLDVLSLKMLGINNVVALMGTFLTKHNLLELKKYQNIKTIILCLDNDNAGYFSTIDLSHFLINSGFEIKIIEPFQKNIKDCNDLICVYEKEFCTIALETKLNYIDFVLNDKKIDNLNLKQRVELLQTCIYNLSTIANKYKYLEEDCKKIATFFGNDNSFSEKIKQIILNKSNQLMI